ncbi:MAG: prolyl oligopeptidase family serine peptidase, partial [Pirellulales bacterium]|nr:prolyl oligopeptidase family serine peptidase [Pirellulales bacterium]
EKGENYKAASPAAFVTKKCCPMFFFHGENDELVSLSSPQAMAKQLDKAGVKNAVHVVEGAGHLAAAMNQDALKAAFDFLDQHLQHSGEKTKPADDRDGR